MALLHPSASHAPASSRSASGRDREARIRRTVNVVLLLAVLLDFAAQAVHLVAPGSRPLILLIATLAMPAAVLLLRR